MPSKTATDLLSTLRDHLAPELSRVEETLAGVLSNRRTALTDDVGDYLRQTAGKRIRPILTLLAANASGGKAMDAVPIAAAMECVHLASLLHDDVVDQAPLRRGAETVQRRYGPDVAILMGNYLYSHAFQLLLDTGDPRPLQIITAATARMCEGEMFQIQIGQNPVSLEDYLRIITDKTAHLISACTEFGALATTDDVESIQAMKGYGMELGRAYQIIDDALDYVGAGNSWGKSLGTDLREGKWTLPLIHTIEHANDRDRRALIEIWNNGRELQSILEIINRYEGIEQCFALAREKSQLAISQLSKMPHSIDLEMLRAIPEFVITRVS